MSNKNEIKIIKKRFKCTKCKTIESHSLNSSKTTCSRCGSTLIEISEKEYLLIKNKQKKDLEEDVKEINYNKDAPLNKDKKKRKSQKSEIVECIDEQKEKKTKKKLRKNLSQCDIKNKEYKFKKDEDEEEEQDEEVDKTKKSSKKVGKTKKKGKRKNRERSVKHIGNYINDIVSNVLGNLGIEGFDNINIGNLEDIDGSTIIINNNNDNSPLKIVVNRQNVSSDIFDPIFSSFGSIFNESFVNNFSSNFASNFNGDFFDQVQTIIENNQQQASKHSTGPTEDKSLNKLKRFNLTNKYCKKGKNGKIELPNCCICLSEIAKGQETVLLPCGHMFHWKCCLNWLKKNNTCPMCRFEIK